MTPPSNTPPPPPPPASDQQTQSILYFFFKRSPIWHAFTGLNNTACGLETRTPIEMGDAKVTERKPTERIVCPDCAQTPDIGYWR